ncbi:MAG: hypothetical protein R3E86_12315 [Pseudomonadales bacterium]
MSEESLPLDVVPAGGAPAHSLSAAEPAVDAPLGAEDAAALRAELSKWRERVPKLAAALRERTEELDALRRNHESLQSRGAGGAGIEARDQLIRELETRLEALNARYKSSQGELHSRDLEIEDLRQDLRSWKDKWHQVTASLDAQGRLASDKDQRLQDLNEELAALRKRNEQLFETTEFANRQLATLGDSLGELRAQARSAADREAELAAERTLLEARVRELDQGLQQRDSEIEQLTDALQTLQAAARQQIDDQRARAREQATAEARVAAVRAELEGRLAAAEQQLLERDAAAGRDRAELETRLGAAEDRARSAEDRALAELRAAKQQFEERLADAERQAAGRVDAAEQQLRAAQERAAEQTRAAQEETAELVRRLQQQADERVGSAEQQAAERIRQAEQQGEELIRQAEQQAEERVRQAEQRAADRLTAAEDRLAEIERQAQARLDEAEELARARVREAEERARSIVDDAESGVAQRLQDAEAQARAGAAELETLREEVARLERCVADAERAHGDREAERRQLCEQLEAASARVERLEAQLDDRAELVRSLEHEQLSLRERQQALEEERAEHAEARQSLEDALLRAERGARENADHITQLDDRIERQKELISELEVELAEARTRQADVPSEQVRSGAGEGRALETQELKEKLRKLEQLVREQSEELNQERWARQVVEQRQHDESSGKMLLVLSQQLSDARAQSDTLRARVGELEEELAHHAQQRGGDDLTQIHGIGPKLAEQLNELGIYRLEQIAGLEEAALGDESHALHGHRGRIVRDGWIEQAARLIRH